jgi:hypothetical protein
MSKKKLVSNDDVKYYWIIAASPGRKGLQKGEIDCN